MLHTIFVKPLIFLLQLFHDIFAGVGIPYAYGFSIIAVTVLLRLLMLPLTIKSMTNMKKMQELQPQVEALKKKYKNDQQKLLLEQQRLYQQHGVTPWGGCLPMLIQFPILIGFYYAVRELAENGELVGQGFFWVPDLAFPDVSQGLSWLWPLPPSVGWDMAIRYLILPVLLLVTQILTQKLASTQSPTGDNPQAQMMNQMMWVMSIFFFYFALTFPSALTLYWVTSNVLGIVQQLYVNRYTAQVSVSPAAAGAGSGTSTGTPVPAADGGQAPTEAQASPSTSSKSQKPAKQAGRKRRRKGKKR